MAFPCKNIEAKAKQEFLRRVVNMVADLVESYHVVTGYSGYGDSIPVSIAHALRNGYVVCHKCFGRGHDFNGDICKKCDGYGTIDFKINEDDI